MKKKKDQTKIIMKSEYQTEVYNSTKLILYFFSISIVIISLLIFIGRLMNSPVIAVGGVIIVFILPFVFEKRLKQLFTKKVILKFDDFSFTVTFYRLDSVEILKEKNFKWGNIKSYEFYFTPTKNTNLTIHFRKGVAKFWGFKDNRSSDEAFQDKESLFNVFSFYIKQFNVGKNLEQEITLRPGLLATIKGTNILYAVIAIMVSGFTFHLIMQPKTSFVTFFIGFFLTLQLFMKGKQEKELYEKIKKLD